MSAGASLQAAIAAALQSVSELTGVYDGPPARASYPYAAVDAGTETDWSHKSGGGREVSVAITLWDDQPVRLTRLADATEQAIQAVAAVEAWDLVSLQMRRRRIVRDVAGPWAAAIDYRARLLTVAS